MARTPFPNHPSATTMRAVWGVAMSRVLSEIRRRPREPFVELYEDMRAADAAVRRGFRRKREQETGEWRVIR